jgi:hypothetical protein
MPLNAWSILAAIHRNLASLDSDVYTAFLKDDVALWTTTKQRVVSYWNCYYRRTWWRRADYVGFQIIEYLDALRHFQAIDRMLDRALNDNQQLKEDDCRLQQEVEYLRSVAAGLHDDVRRDAIPDLVWPRLKVCL